MTGRGRVCVSGGRAPLFRAGGARGGRGGGRRET